MAGVGVDGALDRRRRRNLSFPPKHLNHGPWAVVMGALVDVAYQFLALLKAQTRQFFAQAI